MPSTFTTALRLVKQAAGENSSTWGTIFNQQFSDLIDTAIAGYSTISLSDADKTLTAANGAADEARSMCIKFTGTLTAARNIIVPTTTKLYCIRNATTGGYAITIKTSAGTGVSVPNGQSTVIACDGTNVVDVITSIPSGSTINNLTIGYLGIPQNSQSADYTLVASDASKHIYHPAADTTNRTWTIPANASVAYPIGTAITFITDTGAGNITISINSDTLVLAGPGTTGDRTLTSPASATAVKVTSTRWIISGTGIT